LILRCSLQNPLHQPPGGYLSTHPQLILYCECSSPLNLLQPRCRLWYWIFSDIIPGAFCCFVLLPSLFFQALVQLALASRRTITFRKLIDRKLC
jgi:hypothetical protein